MRKLRKTELRYCFMKMLKVIKSIADNIQKYREKIKEKFKILGVVGFKEKFDIDGIYIP